METEAEPSLTCTQTQTSTPPPSPDPESPDPIKKTSPPHHPPRFGTIIPNRVFVGGIDLKTNENDLRRFFSKLGAVKDVKIVIDRRGVSKGYGFVTFETQADAQKVLLEADRLCFRDKRLNIGQAIRTQQAMHPSSFSGSCRSPPMAVPAPCNTMYLTTSTGYPYTYHNGVAYFHSPDLSPLAPHWPSHHRSMSSPPVMLTHPPQPVYQQPAFHHHQAPAQCVSGHLQWNVPQSPVPSSPVMYMQQPSEPLYQTMEPAPGPDLPLVEATIPEFMEHVSQPTYHQMYAQNAGGFSPLVMQQDPGKEQKFHAMRRGGYPLSPVRYGGSPHYAHPHKDYRQDIADPAPLPASEPLK